MPIKKTEQQSECNVPYIRLFDTRLCGSCSGKQCVLLAFYLKVRCITLDPLNGWAFC
jgi:hypothetical protein